MKKIYKTSLIIGKFYPLHKGHQFLINTAISRSEKLTIILCHCDNYDINPKIRAGWLKELYPKVRVIIYRHSTSLDSTSTSISSTWANVTVKILGFIPDAVFSSENYGQVYAQCMGSEHISVDINRKKIPVSGTQIRSNPYKYWHYLSEPARGFYTKRIVCLGAESTGTTTLAKSLAKHYHTTWVPEYGRAYCEGKMTGKNQSWASGEFTHIAKMQNDLEDSLAKKSNKLLICDTDAFATRLWHERYMKFSSAAVDKIVNTKNKKLFIITGDEIPFVQDGTRDGESIRHWMHNRFISELKRHHLKYIVVRGNEINRQRCAIEEINKLFQ